MLRILFNETSLTGLLHYPTAYHCTVALHPKTVHAMGKLWARNGHAIKQNAEQCLHGFFCNLLAQNIANPHITI